MLILDKRATAFGEIGKDFRCYPRSALNQITDAPKQLLVALLVDADGLQRLLRAAVVLVEVAHGVGHALAIHPRILVYLVRILLCILRLLIGGCACRLLASVGGIPTESTRISIS